MSQRADFIEELSWRGMLNQCTDLEGLRKHLATADFEAGGRRAYIGFDPTADSLTIGNLVQIMVLAHFQRCGHTPIALLGGATGQVGDPSGKSSERTLSDPTEVARRLARQRHIFERVLRFEGVNATRMLNNLDWWGPMTFLEVLREIGKHFSVNMMIQKDSVRERLQSREQGISYTEFSYMILQAYDFYELWKNFAQHGLDTRVTLQMGGSDQWGNIVAGNDLIDRPRARARELLESDTYLVVDALNSSDRPEEKSLGVELHPLYRRPNEFNAALSDVDWHLVLSQTTHDGVRKRVGNYLEHLRIAESATFGLTIPLLMKADGGKFGKTEKGAIWLTAPTAGDDSPNRTTPYALYQYLLNLADADCGKFLRIFTFLTKEEVEDIERRHAADAAQRLAQRTIARSMVAMLHGEDQAEAAEAAAKALFSGDIASLPETLLVEVLAEAPASAHPRSRLEGDGADLVELLVETGLATSKKQAREFLAAGAVTVNGAAAPADHRLRPAHLLHGSMIALRRGKKNWHLMRWE